MTKRSLNKIVEKANDNASMKEFVILKTTKHMIKSMIMKTMIAGRNVEADFECGVDFNKMGKFNKDDYDDSQSTEEACMDDENLFIPLMIKNAMTDVLTTWKEIEGQTYEFYNDY